MGRAFVAGAYAERPIAKSFSEATWEEIIYACKKNLVPDNWNIGDQNTMLINGSTRIIDIIGKNHDEYYDRSGIAPLTFQLHDCYESVRMRGSSTNTGGWEASNVYKTYLPETLALMPAEVQAGIKEIRKITSGGNGNENLVASANKLFLLSEVEVMGDAKWSFPGEGTQYAYYANGGSRQKYLNGALAGWWMRSPSGAFSTTSFCYIDSYGNSDYHVASNYTAMSFAFCF